MDSCQYKTILHAAPPRSNCPEHGARVVKLPWAEPGGRFTALFEGLAISWLKATSQKEVAHLLGMSWDEIHHVMACAVRRGMERREDEPVGNLGVDEMSFKKRHKYLTVVNDLDGARLPQRGQLHHGDLFPLRSPQHDRLSHLKPGRTT